MKNYPFLNFRALQNCWQIIIKKFANKIIITKSTVPVSTGDKIEKILIKQKRKKLVDVVSNPEFLREGEAIKDFLSPDRVVVGSNDIKSQRILKSTLGVETEAEFTQNYKGQKLFGNISDTIGRFFRNR